MLSSEKRFAKGERNGPVDHSERRTPRAWASGRWQASVLTLFPEMFPGPLGVSLLGKALEKSSGRSKCATSANTAWANTARWMTRPRGADRAW